jgi:hypothetical protein
VLVAGILATAACMKPNPAFVDTDASDDVLGADDTTTGCAGDDGVPAPDSETRAIDLGTMPPGATPGIAEGMLTPEVPSWWFTFATSTDSGAGRIVATLQADAGAELCVFLECVDAPGVPTLLCDGGTWALLRPLGGGGCGPADGVALWHACTADLNVFVQVAAPDIDACLPFEVEYRLTEPGG